MVLKSSVPSLVQFQLLLSPISNLVMDISLLKLNTVKLGFKELFGHHKKVPYFKHLTKAPSKVYLTRNQGKMAVFWNQYFY